jgi:hypothetical protein
VRFCSAIVVMRYVRLLRGDGEVWVTTDKQKTKICTREKTLSGQFQDRPHLCRLLTQWPLLWLCESAVEA